MLCFRLIKIRNETKGHRTPCCGESAERSAYHDGCEIWRDCVWNLPDVYQEQGELEDRPAPKLFGPRRPKLTAEAVKY
jgi:hypothetical protein